jgi:hypothetical protein
MMWAGKLQQEGFSMKMENYRNLGFFDMNGNKTAG